MKNHVIYVQCFQSLNPVLVWQTSTGADSYEYCYDTIGNNACDGNWLSTVGATTANLVNLNNNSIYYWQVRAVNTASTIEANDGVWWSFTTEKYQIYLPLITKDMIFNKPTGSNSFL